jgi:hypothetical protein
MCNPRAHSERIVFSLLFALVTAVIQNVYPSCFATLNASVFLSFWTSRPSTTFQPESSISVLCAKELDLELPKADLNLGEAELEAC